MKGRPFMGTVIFRNSQNLNEKEVLSKFESTLKENDNFKKSEIEQLVDAYAKNPVDKFIVSDEDLMETFGRQGDILFWPENSEMYKKEIKGVHSLVKTERLVLQPNDSITGDHRVVPLPNSNYSIQTGKFKPSFLKGKNRWGDRDHDCIILDIDKPFLVVHREHGNIALTAGKYMICSQLDPQTLNRMMD